MNTSPLKTYAPAARRDFIRAVTDRAHLLGLSEKGAIPMDLKGDVVLIGGRPYPAKVAAQREGLDKRIRLSSFEHVMEAAAYTWFNRFAALRFMELHGYLEHGYRVLSHPQGGAIPEILEQAANIELPGLERDTVVALKLDGNKDAELYRLLLVAQCNALSNAMPFLFERIDDETELLLPDNLLHSDSLIRKLVTEVEEESWQQVEIIGWLYQFYISEKKDQVIGKVVKSEDIPAATQLFTPNWIVKYMVQNSLGAQWLATYPDSKLKEQMEYYIEPAEQTDEVNAQLAAITPDKLNPEELTLIDPACGSGHILVEAYELFKAIYLERGYRQRDVPQLILEKNLFGLDIDERAAQLTGFALMMKGRADDRQLFARGVKLNVMALVDSTGFDAERLAPLLRQSQEHSRHSRVGGNLDDGLKIDDLSNLKQLFEQATTFGSLIQVPTELAEKLPAIKQLSEATSPDLFVSEALKRLGPLVQQGELLAAQFDAVVANPPYMGGLNEMLKTFAKSVYQTSKTDLYSMFIERGLAFLNPTGLQSFITMQSWMFLSSFEELRRRILRENTIISLAHLGPHAFDAIPGERVQVCMFVLSSHHIVDRRGKYYRLIDGNAEKKQSGLLKRRHEFSRVTQDIFLDLPDAAIAYKISDSPTLISRLTSGNLVKPNSKIGSQPGSELIILWWEVNFTSIGRFWRFYNKGGPFRKWYGNQYWILKYGDNGSYVIRHGGQLSNQQFYFREHISWTRVSSKLNLRYYPAGFGFDNTAPAILENLNSLGGFLNSCVGVYSRTLKFYGTKIESGHIESIATVDVVESRDSIEGNTNELLVGHAGDWNSYEASWDFQFLPLLTASSDSTPTLESSYTAWITQNRDTIAEMKRLEEENNRLFIDAYGLQDELTPDVPIEQITLTVNPAYRYGGKLSEEEQWTRFRQDTMAELVSYAIGCMMGRYSLDEPGLIYAHSGNEGFDRGRYTTFPADDDGIIPLTDFEWFSDDAANRLVQFISVAWNKRHLEDNLRFLADNLSPKKGETSRETLRRYLCDSFFKNHLQTYKKRPIYWLFSSGKQKAFQCLVYLHRHNEGTLARMRTEYVTPLQGKLSARVSNLQDETASAPSTAVRNRLQKQLDIAKKKQTELAAFDDLLRHYADQRIHLDLDDGVKVNYGRFGTLLAEVKAVTGGSADD
ncbi:MAG: BREX-1 system adenine-specific DNA-methyltransferase PglX [Gammaproteobacteria bacterium]|nr:BREX-1 system adenine-specific DNA-methyltransferase PglX [Gammaproteobacteria bacterium]